MLCPWAIDIPGIIPVFWKKYAIWQSFLLFNTWNNLPQLLQPFLLTVKLLKDSYLSVLSVSRH